MNLSSLRQGMTTETNVWRPLTAETSCSCDMSTAMWRHAIIAQIALRSGASRTARSGGPMPGHGGSHAAASRGAERKLRGLGAYPLERACLIAVVSHFGHFLRVAPHQGIGSWVDLNDTGCSRWPTAQFVVALLDPQDGSVGIGVDWCHAPTPRMQERGERSSTHVWLMLWWALLSGCHAGTRVKSSLDNPVH